MSGFSKALLRGSRVVAAALLFLSAAAAATPGRPSWPQTGSDLAADPAVTFGVLDNGLRYAVEHNRVPRGGVSIRLLILAGAMNEAHDQEGLAHFLEHMAFHGSTHIADSDVIPTLERLGMRMGADINAFTGRDYTIFKFDLPKTDDASVDTALTMSRDICSELTLDPKLMDSERKVILAELYSHSAPLVSLETTQAQAIYGEHPFARSPIGRTEVIENAPAARLRAFYDAYYRPERAVLVVVGDVDSDQIAAKIKAKFADWQGRGAAGSDPGPIATTGHEPARFKLAVIPGLDLQAQVLELVYRQPLHPAAESKGEAMQREIGLIASEAAAIRLQQLNAAQGRPFATGGLIVPLVASVAHYGVSGASLIADWRGALDLLVRAQRQIVEFGLAQSEIDTEIALHRATLERQVAQSYATSSQTLADNIAGNAVLDRVVLSPQQTLDLFNETASGLSAERVNAFIHARFSGLAPVVFYSSSAPLDGGEAALKAVYDKAMAEPISHFQPTADKAWPYTQFGPPGKVAEQRRYEALNVTMVKFANGVRLTVKPMPYLRNQVNVLLRFGHGHLDLPRDRVAASDFAAETLSLGGFRNLTALEAGRALMGQQNVSAIASIGEDAFTIQPASGAAITPENLDREMQVLAAQVSEPGWRTDYWPTLIAALARADDANEASPVGVFNSHSPQLLHPGDARWVLDTAQMRAGFKPEDAIAFMKPILATAPLEVIVVGDITPERAIEAVAGTLGALPPRPEPKEPVSLREVHFPAPTPVPIALHHEGTAQQALAVIEWPTTDAFADQRDTEASAVLAAIMQERAIAQLRIKEGRTYSPSVVSEFSAVLPRYGAIRAMVEVEPADIDATFAELDAIAADLAAHDVSADEFSRALAPRIESARRSRFYNPYWLNALANAQTDPRLMELAANQLDTISALTVADVRKAAQKWLVKEKSWRLMVTPEAKN